MMKRTVSFLLMAAAVGCGSDVDLQLDLERGTDSLRTPPVGEPAWQRTDFDELGGNVAEVAWTTDGGLVASSPLFGTVSESGDSHTVNQLTRYDGEGTILWDVQSVDDHYFGVVNATAVGGVVVAVSPWMVPGVPSPDSGGLDWYDAGGALTASWRLDATDTHDKLDQVIAVEPLPDGGVVWAGRTLSDDDRVTSVAGRFDAQGQLLWMIPFPRPVRRRSCDRHGARRRRRDPPPGAFHS